MSHLAEGNLKAALAELTAVAAEADRGDYTGVAAAAHRTLAVIEAALGDKHTPHVIWPAQPNWAAPMRLPSKRSPP